MSKDTTFKLQTIVRKHGDRYTISLEGSGFSGEGEAYTLSTAFEAAFRDLTEKLLEGTAG